jgi:hypothetical protein
MPDSTSLALQRASIQVKPGIAVDGPATLACRFNPKEYSITKSATWKTTPVSSSAATGTTQFIGANPRQLQMELFFDSWDSESGDVAADVSTLIGWTNPTQESIRNHTPQPPILIFHWGTSETPSFEAYLLSVNAHFTLFQPDGTPARATASISLQETPQSAQRQNPTSGGVPGRRTHTVAFGDSLQSIAYAEYRSPALWRGIAEANAIDDPFRLEAGTALMIPPKAQAAELS